ncbi:hypothetical protein [Streptomyces sp. NP-1717]|uniref:hypothetical protein n=1 Tax=Streptomyces sp. NP-1717 TaxID=2704470 RepID=UPI001F5D997D|nr:hypothetical protein [Streptomyces sp. NP-1717]MCI3225414.1 hypothetical protein [Streptomyces sp. NP-1717]
MSYTTTELKSRYSDPEEQKKLLRLFGLRSLMTNSILPNRYKVPSALHDPIILTPAGDELCKRLMRIRNFKWPDVRLACFLEFYHDELFVDHLQTDIPALTAALNVEITEGRIRHPYVWGRELYDKAYEIFPHEPSEVSAAETARLLEGTPRGVFQEMDLVTGPLGILRSEEFRLIPATVDIPLFHCSKVSCTRVHRTYLRTTESQIHKIRDKVAEILDKEYGKESEFGLFLMESSNSSIGYYDDMKTANDIALLGECFTREELDSIALFGFKGRESHLRRALTGNGVSVRDAKDFLQGLDKAGVTQALLLMTSKHLYACIDAAIHSGAIAIPQDEVRVPRIIPIESGYYDTTSECSTFGVRVVPSDGALAVLRLKRLVLSIYDLEAPSARDNLSWRLRRVDGNTLEEKLDSYLTDEQPSRVVRDLILIGPESFATAARLCGVSELIEAAAMEDEELTNIILWKLGFEPVSSDENAGILRQRRDVFAQAVANFIGYSESDRSRIRSHSSNLFVALEHTLDAALSYCVWALTYDHVTAHPRFQYLAKDARVQMAHVLNQAPARGGDAIIYSPQGLNTLFPLISGFSRLRDYLMGKWEESEAYLRASEDMPPYVSATDLTRFGFPYTIPFLNLARDSQEKILEHLGDATRILESGQVAGVRNRLEHQREDFPTADEMNRCIRAIEDFLELIEQSGIYPMVFTWVGFSGDSAGRRSFSYVDYRGREYVLRTPTGIAGTGTPPRKNKQIIFTGAVISGSTMPLSFSIGSQSSYTEAWQDWPKLRTASSFDANVRELGTRASGLAG